MPIICPLPANPTDQVAASRYSNLPEVLNSAVQCRRNYGNAAYAICSPTGAVVLVPIGLRMMKDFVQSTSQWAIVGVTRDSAGVALGGCRVIVLSVGRLQLDGAPVVGETVSDGSGTYSVPVPHNTAYQVLAYKPGAPDVTGATLNTITPTQV